MTRLLAIRKLHTSALATYMTRFVVTFPFLNVWTYSSNSVTEIHSSPKQPRCRFLGIRPQPWLHLECVSWELCTIFEISPMLCVCGTDVGNWDLCIAKTPYKEESGMYVCTFILTCGWCRSSYAVNAGSLKRRRISTFQGLSVISSHMAELVEVDFLGVQP